MSADQPALGREERKKPGHGKPWVRPMCSIFPVDLYVGVEQAGRKPRHLLSTYLLTRTIFVQEWSLFFLIDGLYLSSCKAGKSWLGVQSAFSLSLFLIYFIYLYMLYRLDGGEGKREGEKQHCVVAPYWGPGWQPRHMPWLGIEPVTLWFTSWHSIHWATSARALSDIF